jgi:hypothetical protein
LHVCKNSYAILVIDLREWKTKLDPMATAARGFIR